MFSVHPPLKKIRFDDVVQVFRQSPDWTERDYIGARRGTWIVDRLRFERRIRELSNIIEPILSNEHRLVVLCRNMSLSCVQ